MSECTWLMALHSTPAARRTRRTPHVQGGTDDPERQNTNNAETLKKAARFLEPG